MKPNVLICGGFGYVGEALSRYLGIRGFDVYRVGRGRCMATSGLPGVRNLPPADLLDYHQCEPLVRGMRWIFNLAADVGGIGHVQSHKAAGFASATINTNLLRAIVETKTKIDRYFFASSSCVYGEDPYSIKDDPWGNGHPANEELAFFSTASEGYGQAKFFAERTCEAFKQEHNIPVRIARYHSVYGPRESRPGKEHFLESLVNKFTLAQQTGVREITVWGNGLQRRNLLYIDDCVEGTARIAFGECSDPINLAHRDPVTVNEVITKLEQISKISVTRFYNTAFPVGVKNKTANISKLISATGWEPKIGTLEGLARTWNLR